MATDYDDLLDDDLDPDDDDQGGQQQPEPETKELREIRKQNRAMAKQLKQLQGQNVELQKSQRELMFVRAGLDPNDPKTKYFVAGYDGELEPEAIKKSATEAGFLSPPKDDGPPQQGAATEVEQIGFEAMDDAFTGTALPGDRGADILTGMREIYDQGGTPEDVGRWLAAQGYPVAQGYE